MRATRLISAHGAVEVDCWLMFALVTVPGLTRAIADTAAELANFATWLRLAGAKILTNSYSCARLSGRSDAVFAGSLAAQAGLTDRA